MVAVPRQELVELVTDLYPLLQQRHQAPVPILKFIHVQLLVWAWQSNQARGIPRARRWYRMDPQDWADMALRVMLEYDRVEHEPRNSGVFRLAQKVGHRY